MTPVTAPATDARARCFCSPWFRVTAIRAHTRWSAGHARREARAVKLEAVRFRALAMFLGGGGLFVGLSVRLGVLAPRAPASRSARLPLGVADAVLLQAVRARARAAQLSFDGFLKRQGSHAKMWVVRVPLGVAHGFDLAQGGVGVRHEKNVLSVTEQ